MTSYLISAFLISPYDIARGIGAAFFLGLTLLSLLSLYVSLTGHFPGYPFSERRKSHPLISMHTQAKLFLLELRRQVGAKKDMLDPAHLQKIEPQVVHLALGHLLSHREFDPEQTYLLYYGVKEARLGSGSYPIVRIRKTSGDNELLRLSNAVEDHVHHLIGHDDVWISPIYNRDISSPGEEIVYVPIRPETFSTHTQMAAIQQYRALTA